MGREERRVLCPGFWPQQVGGGNPKGRGSEELSAGSGDGLRLWSCESRKLVKHMQPVRKPSGS